MGERHKLDDVRCGRVPATGKPRDAMRDERPQDVTFWMLRWDALRSTKIPHRVELDVLAYIEGLEATLLSQRVMLREVAGDLYQLLDAYIQGDEYPWTEPDDYRHCLLCYAKWYGDENEYHEADCPVTRARDWLHRAGVAGVLVEDGDDD